MLKPISYERRKAWAGRGFISLWFIGFAVFFLYPLLTSFIYTFQELIFEGGKSVFTNIGLENYVYAFMSDPYLIDYFSTSFANMFTTLPLIILFSLFAAVLLNREFRGRGLVRSVFFFPVIITSGALIYVLNTETTALQNTSADVSVMLGNAQIQEILRKLLGNDRIAQPIVAMMDRVFVIIWKSGVQTLLFLAGLQSISSALYESADIEGASAWEKFWKITFPMVSPVMLVNVVYTAVDSFTDYDNSMLRYALTCIFGKIQYTYGTTISWLYFLATFVVMIALVGVISRKVFYIND